MINNLLNWLDNSTCSFLAVETLKSELKNAGFKQLDPAAEWNLEPSTPYFIEKNDSALFAFVTPSDFDRKTIPFKVISAHSDSPCLKLKPNPCTYNADGTISLGVEKYGGGILYTWFDRPLSMSGRVFVKNENDLLNPEVRVFDLKKPVATIPHLAIHFNRQVNEGNAISVQRDMQPIIGPFKNEELLWYSENGGFIREIIAEHLNMKRSDIIDLEVCFYPCEKAEIIGFNEKLIQSGRLDDLTMAFAGLQSMLDTYKEPDSALRILAIFDNEETGSATKQGAASPVLRNLIERIFMSVGADRETYLCSIDKSFMISADNAHAWHPHYQGSYDPKNHPEIGKGPVLKINSSGKYMTDAESGAVFRELCRKAGVNCQIFVNHSDIAGGSTLGNILTSQIDLRGVDVGSPIWAMHSSRETGAVSDYTDMVNVFSVFFQPLN